MERLAVEQSEAELHHDQPENTTMAKSIYFGVEVAGVFKVESTVCNETEAVQAIRRVKEGFQILKGLNYPPESKRYTFGVSPVDGDHKGWGFVDNENDGNFAVQSLAFGLFQRMIVFGLLDVNTYPIIAAGY